MRTNCWEENRSVWCCQSDMIIYNTPKQVIYSILLFFQSLQLHTTKSVDSAFWWKLWNEKQIHIIEMEIFVWFDTILSSENKGKNNLLSSTQNQTRHWSINWNLSSLDVSEQRDVDTYNVGNIGKKCNNTGLA